MKISNELLTAVMGCECEFKGFYKSYVKFESEDSVAMALNDEVSIEPIAFCWIINLDTFILLAYTKQSLDNVDEVRADALTHLDTKEVIKQIEEG